MNTAGTTPSYVVTQTVNATNAAQLTNANAYIGFVGGTTRATYYYDGRTCASMAALLQQGLSATVPGFPAVLNQSCTYWGNDPYARGAYSYQVIHFFFFFIVLFFTFFSFLKKDAWLPC